MKYQINREYHGPFPPDSTYDSKEPKSGTIPPKPKDEKKSLTSKLVNYFF